jgi:hypothetical protein
VAALLYFRLNAIPTLNSALSNCVAASIDPWLAGIIRFANA